MGKWHNAQVRTAQHSTAQHSTAQHSMQHSAQLNAQVRQLSSWHSIALCTAAYVEGNAAPSITDMQQLRHQQQGHTVILECM
jgi:hypothetical protein